MVKINLISLGCAKNLVDSEVIMGKLGAGGYSFSSFTDADVIIINTCSFVQDARDESYKMISDVLKNKRAFQRLVVCGCLPQLDKKKLFSIYPDVDAVIGSADFFKIDTIISELMDGRKHIYEVGVPSFVYTADNPRLLSTPSSYAYIKIAEGCSNDCSYCMIPRLRGTFRSRDIDDIIREARMLADMGIKELVVTAQDVTRYGHDSGCKYLLQKLLQRLDTVKGIKWIRLLYTHPAHFTKKLVKTIASSEKLCRYIDIPLQHTHDEILKKMNRPGFAQTRKIVDMLHKEIQGVTLRTTFMVGFPSEEDKHYEKLLKDVRDLQFDWAGVFMYSSEKNTPAYKIKPKIPDKVKKARYNKLMEAQQEITLAKNKLRVGKTFYVLVDTQYEGHAEFQAPEIDGKILFSRKHTPGTSVKCKIARVQKVYDLLVQ